MEQKTAKVKAHNILMKAGANEMELLTFRLGTTDCDGTTIRKKYDSTQ